MKTTHLLFTSALLIAVIFASCKKDKNESDGSKTKPKASLTFTVNGPGFNNKTFTLTGLDASFGNEGLFFTKMGYSQLAVSNQTEEASSNTGILLQFDGQATGTQKAGTSFKNPKGNNNPGKVTVFITLPQNNSSITYSSMAGGTLNITKYGAVGETIEGDFTVNLASNLKVTNGHFVVPRTDDDTISN